MSEERASAGGVFHRALLVGRLALTRGFRRHELPTRAASLTYVTLFSLVPVLAVAFMVFKALGYLERAQRDLVPRLLDFIVVGSRDVVEARINEFVGNIHGGAVGSVAALFLFFGVVGLMGEIENTLNRIWEAPESRTFVRRVTMYWATVTLTPIILLAGLLLPTAGRRLPFLALLLESALGKLLISAVLPLLLVYVGFTLLYVLVPNTRVPLRPALMGAAVSGSVWWLAWKGYAFYAASTVAYSRIYGSLGALAIFLIWIFLTWLIVLLGAEVAAAIEYVPEDEERVEELGPAALELLALRVLAAVSGRFVRGETPLVVAEVAQDLHVTPGQVRVAAEALRGAGLLVAAGDSGHLVPARDPHRTSLAAALRALRHADEAVPGADADLGVRQLIDLRDRADAAARGVLEDVSIADLALGRRPPA